MFNFISKPILEIMVMQERYYQATDALGISREDAGFALREETKKAIASPHVKNTEAFRNAILRFAK